MQFAISHKHGESLEQRQAMGLHGFLEMTCIRKKGACLSRHGLHIWISAYASMRHGPKCDLQVCMCSKSKSLCSGAVSCVHVVRLHITNDNSPGSKYTANACHTQPCSKSSVQHVLDMMASSALHIPVLNQGRLAVDSATQDGRSNGRIWRGKCVDEIYVGCGMSPGITTKSSNDRNFM